mgnify:CR=1 FL=1
MPKGHFLRTMNNINIMKEEILKFFKGEVEDGEETLVKYSRDASIFDIRPKVVVFPKDSADVQALVKWVSENKEKDPSLSIICRCAGTDMSGGPLNESIIMDTTRYMNKIISVDTEKGVAQPGVYYRDFEKET